MREQKLQTKNLARDFNIKYKNFLEKLENMYSFIDKEETPAEVAAKILLYSREA